ncbi:transcriptional regulator (plasmid) [Natrinema zhouii]|uniref:transcriptional regulator n=1 Tax=Natrinema zhouii TaxID=1710539 RepID=UPI001CFFC50F|nr:transcriptional regulator [Natrinema zhouii]UHQ98597.1 transcriptional regulator [Natrinema zhouii]
MADLNPIAKRIHNVSPDPIRLTLDDGTKAVFHIFGAEFFQQEFQAEGTRVDDDDAEYRFVSSDDNETILVGRKGPEDSGWSMVGSILDTAPAESE